MLLLPHGLLSWAIIGLHRLDGAHWDESMKPHAISRFHRSVFDVLVPVKMVIYLHGRVCANQWMTGSDASMRQHCTEVMLRRTRGNYTCAPEKTTGVLLAVVRELNVEVAFTMITETVDIILSALAPHQSELTMNDGSPTPSC